MVAAPPDPRLGKLLREKDELAQLLLNERRRSGILRAKLDRERAERGQRTNDAKPEQQRAEC